MDQPLAADNSPHQTLASLSTRWANFSGGNESHSMAQLLEENKTIMVEMRQQFVEVVLSKDAQMPRAKLELAAWAIAEIASFALVQQLENREQIINDLLPGCQGLLNARDAVLREKGLIALSVSSPLHLDVAIPTFRSALEERISNEATQTALFGLMQYEQPFTAADKARIHNILALPKAEQALDPLWLINHLGQAGACFLPYVLEQLSLPQANSTFISYVATAIVDEKGPANQRVLHNTLFSNNPAAIRIATVLLRRFEILEGDTIEQLQKLGAHERPMIRASAERTLAHFFNESEFEPLKSFYNPALAEDFSVELFSPKQNSEMVHGLKDLVCSIFRNERAYESWFLDDTFISSRVYVVRSLQSDQFVGFVNIQDKPEESDTCAAIYSLLVTPEYQGHGIARELLQSAIADAKRLGYTLLFRESKVENGWADRVMKQHKDDIIAHTPIRSPSGEERMSIMMRIPD